MNETVRSLLAANREHARADPSRFDDLQDGQRPAAVSVCCSDSRVLQEHLWGVDEPGRVFTVGNIGNRVVQRTAAGESVVSGDVLYPIAYTGTDTLLVVGHTGCGAVTATYDALTDGAAADHPPGVEHCVDLLAPRLEAGVAALPGDLDRGAAIDRLVEYNVDRQIAFCLESADVPEDTAIVGVVYDFQDVYGGRRGEVHVVNVGGDRDVGSLRETYPDVADRIDRLAVLD
jgi:carbonic anhydrase